MSLMTDWRHCWRSHVSIPLLTVAVCPRSGEPTVNSHSPRYGLHRQTNYGEPPVNDYALHRQTIWGERYNIRGSAAAREQPLYCGRVTFLSRPFAHQCPSQAFLFVNHHLLHRMLSFNPYVESAVSKRLNNMLHFLSDAVFMVYVYA